MMILYTGGKRDEELILPINSSLSVTLHQDQVRKALKGDQGDIYTQKQVIIRLLYLHD